MFAQGNESQMDHRKCFRCGKKGHIATNCPAEKPGPAPDAKNDDDSGDHLHTMCAVESDGSESAGAEDESSDDACYFFH